MLSAAYALCMMVVVVGLGLNMILEGMCSPTAIFLFFLLGVFIVTAILHPQTPKLKMMSNSIKKHTEENEICNQTLNDLGYSKDAVDERIRINSVSSEAMTMTANKLFGNDVDKVLVGSQREGISLFGESDADVMIVLKNLVAVEDPAVGNHHGRQVFAMEMEAVPTGYTLLRLIDGSEINPLIADSLEEYNSAQYLSSNKIMTANIDKFRMRGGWRDGAISRRERRGPSIPESLISDDIYSRLLNTITGDHELINNDTDKVQAIPVECPSLLQAWINRPRPNKWPTNEMLVKFSQLPVHVVPVGRSGSMCEDLQWRICFTMGEIYLVQQFHDTQIKMLVFMRIIAKKILKPVSRKFSSFVIKNVALWLSEELPQESFQPEFLLSRIQDGLQYLLKSIQKKQLPSYTNPGRNLLHSLHGDEAYKAEEALLIFLSDYYKNVMNIVTEISKDSSQLKRLSNYNNTCTRLYKNIKAEPLSELGIQSAKCNTSFHQHRFNMRLLIEANGFEASNIANMFRIAAARSMICFDRGARVSEDSSPETVMTVHKQ